MLKCQISWKSVQREPSCSLRTDGQTDRHDEANCRFSQVCDHAQKWGLLYKNIKWLAFQKETFFFLSATYELYFQNNCKRILVSNLLILRIKVLLILVAKIVGNYILRIIFWFFWLKSGVHTDCHLLEKNVNCTLRPVIMGTSRFTFIVPIHKLTSGTIWRSVTAIRS